MIRADLLTKLGVVAPALATNDLVPILSHFWFTGSRLMTYNDQIAISVACKTDFEGAVPATMLSLLRTSKAKEIEMLFEDDNLLIKAASSRFKLGIMSADNFVFKMPEPKSEEKSPIADVQQFMWCLETCMRSLSADTSVPDRMGITLFDDGSMFSTDGSTMSRARVKLKGDLSFKDRVILNAQFCRQVYAIGKDAKAISLEFYDDHSLMTVGNTTLFGRLIESEKPISYFDVMDHHYPKGTRNKMIAIPSKLRMILERAIIITDSKIDQTKTNISVSAGKMRFESKSDRGEVMDTMQVENHADISLSLDPKLIKNGVDDFDKMLIANGCFIMTRGSAVYLVATGD